MAEMEAPQASGRKGRRGRGGGEEEENEGGGGRKKSGEGGVRGRGGSYGSSKGAWARERRMLGVLRSRRGSPPPFLTSSFLTARALWEVASWRSI